MFAGDNETISDVVSAPSELEEITQEHNIDEVESSQSDEGILEAGNNVINVVNVKDSYNETSKTWDEDGFNLAGATIKVYDSSNKLISTHKTDSNGNAIIKNLGSSVYYLEVSFSTYEPIVTEKIDFTKNSGSVDIKGIQFVPDILLLVDYNSHNEKVDVLMNMSRRVAYISTTDFDKSRAWLVEYAKYMHIDMFSESAYSVLTAKYLKELLARSPANKDYNVAYTFSVFSKQILNNTGIHIVGASAANNTFDTIENTYIGSYFQARDIAESNILQSNMKNYLSYVKYLIDPEKYSNPTDDENNAPLMSPECGFYHPDLGLYSFVPSGKSINQWIHDNPGYTHSSDGSLNWMTENYVEWLIAESDPTALFKNFENDYIARFNPDKPFIAIASYYGGEEVADALIRGYEANGRPAFNVFKTGTQPPMSSILNKIASISTVGISAINSLCSWSLDYANGTAEPDLSDIDLHVLKGIVEISEYSYLSELGPQVEWTFMVTYPSFEGVFGQVALSYVDSLGKSHVIQKGVDKMVQLNCKWADLHDLNNSDKKVAVMLYNYPPGKAEIGASYLDVFDSTFELLYQLYNQGYDIGGDFEFSNRVNNTYQWIINSQDSYLINKTRVNLISLYNLTQLIFDMNNKGSWAKGLLNTYVEENWDYLMEHHQLISLTDFERLTSDVDDDLFNQMISYWKDGLGPAMVYKEKYIVIPGVWFGNVFITFQPSRGWEEVQDYHSLTIPPHQQYVTFYKWMEKTAKMNAIISMGTHGTLEWLPGINLGAFPGDWTFELTLLPTVYPYIVSNPGEAMVARDRSSSLMITHMTPAMVSSELYGNYTTLKNYINYYKEQLSLNVTSNAESYKEMILELAPSLGFRNISQGESFQDWIDELHIYLDDMEDDFNTFGLHRLGKILTGYELSEEVITIVTSQTKIYDQLLEFLYPDLKGLKFYDDIQGNLKYQNEADRIKSFLKVYASRLVNGSSVKQLNEEYGISEGSALYNSTLYCEDIIANIQLNNEWNAILLALSGNYVKAGLFADPSYGDSIPTGYDGYASDPTRMPSHAAYASAVRIVDMLLANYYEEHGKWPELTSLILWGTEISRTEGIGVAEFMYFLGCKPVWADNGKVLGVEQIPIENLTVTLNNGSVVNRPRIDVFASMVTNNKDWITWMLTAVQLAADAVGENETNNYVIKHYAENPHLDRLFGLPGNVLEGTGMSNLIPNTADWSIDSINEYAMDIYLNKVSYSWTLDEKGNIVVTKQKDVYEYLLDNVDVITQNFDSSWRLFDSDDYYDWFGGLYNAANVLKERSGKDKPDTAFFDIRNKNKYISRTYQEELEFEIRSILLNPQYYNALVNTPAGMNAYASRFQNFYATTVLGGEKLNTELGNQLTDTILNINSGVNSNTLAAGSQSSMAWMIYMAQQGLWDGDASSVQKLVDAYMQSVIDYGVACCHHTCKNLAWNSEIIQLSSLTPAQKQKFAEILAQATETDPLYQMDKEMDSQGTQGTQGQGSENGDKGNQKANALSNSTSQQSQSDGSNSGGQTAAGSDPSQSGNAKSASDSSSSQDASSGGESTGGAKSYEISEKSAAKSSSSTESSMPIFVIIAVIVLIAIFLVGYTRSNKDDYDDY
ncbi:cobaltochelatase subunit CobN [Methanobrevibacter sp. UBA212]|uniref:cobaltochelatase subunit CobN n=1 Tax=Methanobrevibacter sp. UBA212 TaxID=1915476 RepID=UPI0025E98C7D|nr:cobaltochelatase subunit CobN [Methanobrevibacter sp. UBA212]